MSHHRVKCKCCSSCDARPPIDGCLSCACARSDTHKVCIQGETGDAAVLNSAGHILTRVSDWLFRFESAASFKVELEFDPDEVDTGEFEIRSYLWDGDSFEIHRTLTGTVLSMDSCYQELSPVDGASYSMHALADTVPDHVTVTTDYFNATQITCTDNRAYGHPTTTWIIDSFTGLDGTFDLDLVSLSTCSYAATQGTVTMSTAEGAPETLTDLPVIWTFDMVSKQFKAEVDFSGSPYPGMICVIWLTTLTGSHKCVPGGGTYGPTSNGIGCSGPFSPTLGGTRNGTDFAGVPLDLDLVEIEVPSV